MTTFEQKVPAEVKAAVIQTFAEEVIRLRDVVQEALTLINRNEVMRAGDVLRDALEHE